MPVQVVIIFLFFSTIGKSTFMRYFYQYAGFISGDTDHAPGSLSDVSLLDHKWKRGFLAFLRLIGVVYFKKHSSGFDIQSPLSLHSKFEDLSIEQQHYKWIDHIRQTMWYRTNFENEMLASNDALMLHWKRTCWILHMWNQADNNQMVLQSMVGISRVMYLPSSGTQKIMKPPSEREFISLREGVSVP